MPVEVDVIDDPRRAQVMLQEQRLELMAALGEPASAAALARHLGLPRQRINYHLKELAQYQLIEVVAEKRRGNCVERIYRRTGESYTISTAALGKLGTDPSAMQDRCSSAYQIALASRAVRDLGILQTRAQAAGKRLPTFGLEVDVRFASAAARKEFAEALAAAVADLARKYHDDKAKGGRYFTFYLGGYPRPK